MRSAIRFTQVTAVAIIAFVTPSLAQNGAVLPLGRDSLTIFVVRGADTSASGWVRDELRQRTQGSQIILERIYRSSDRIMGEQSDTILDRSDNLFPMDYRSRSSASQASIRFTPGRATGWTRNVSGDSLPLDVSLPPGAINAASFDLYLRSAPLRLEWSTEVPAFLASSRSVTKLVARVAGLDRIESEQCWRVETDFAGSSVVFWVGQQSRRLCQQVMNIRPGLSILFRRGSARLPAIRSGAT